MSEGFRHPAAESSVRYKVKPPWIEPVFLTTSRDQLSRDMAKPLSCFSKTLHVFFSESDYIIPPSP